MKKVVRGQGTGASKKRGMIRVKDPEKTVKIDPEGPEASKHRQYVPREWSLEEAAIAGILATMNVIQTALDEAWRELKALQRKFKPAAKRLKKVGK